MASKEKRELARLYIYVILLGCITIYFITQGIRTFSYIEYGNKLARTTTPYQQTRDSDYSILILGDSLAYGVGASSPRNSFAGQIGSKYKNANIVNKAKVGEDTSSLAQSIDHVTKDRYDLAFVIVGGNDIAHYGVDIEQTKRNLAYIYKVLGERVGTTYGYTTVNFDRVSAAPGPLGSFYSKRSQILAATVKDISAHRANIKYVDAFNVDKKQYRDFEAKDGFHLNDQGVQALVNLTFKD